MYGEGVLYQMWAQWNKVDPRYLSIRLLSASNLPAMDGADSKATTDAYAVAYIMPPDPDLPESPLKAAADEVDLPPASPTKGLLARMGLPTPAWAPAWATSSAAAPAAPAAAKAADGPTYAATKAALLAAVGTKDAPAPASAPASAPAPAATATPPTAEDAAAEERAAQKVQAILRGNNSRREGGKGGWGAGMFSQYSWQSTYYTHCTLTVLTVLPYLSLCSSQQKQKAASTPHSLAAPHIPHTRTHLTPHSLHSLHLLYSVRAARRKTTVARRLTALTAMPAFAVKAARNGDWRLALKRLVSWVKGALRIKGALPPRHRPRRPRHPPPLPRHPRHPSPRPATLPLTADSCWSLLRGQRRPLCCPCADSPRRLCPTHRRASHFRYAADVPRRAARHRGAVRRRALARLQGHAQPRLEARVGRGAAAGWHDELRW